MSARAVAVSLAVSALLGGQLAADTPLDSWRFTGAVGRSLNQVPNSAPSRTSAAARWDVAIPHSSTTATGAFRIANSGARGPGRRTSFVNFASERSAGRVVLTLALERWNLRTSPSGVPPRLELDFILGENRPVAGLVLALDATSGQLRYGWRRDDGEPNWQPFPLPAASATGATFRLGIDLDTARLSASLRRTDQPERLIGIARLAPGTDRLTSLRLAVRGDFSGGGDPAYFLDLAALRFDIDEAPHAPGLAVGSDGQPGLLIAALGWDQPELDPRETAPRVAPAAEGNLEYRFFRARADLDYVVETSPDLRTWEEWIRNPGSPDSFVTRTAPALLPGESARFFRLIISLPGP